MPGDWDPEPDVSNDILDRLSPEVLETFTPEQRAALWGAAKPSTWRYHPIDLRISLPLLGSRLFMAVVAGVERRGVGRRRRDSATHPFFTGTNLLFLLIMFVIAVAIGTVVTDVLNWLTHQIDLLSPASKGAVLPKP